MKQLALLIFLYLFYCINTSAQNPPAKKYQFETITIDDGLSQGMVNWITQDHLGFIWIATKDGLNRYDGSNFVIYRHDPKDAKSLADNYVRSVFEDSKNRLWLITASNGIDLFDRVTETFTHFKHDEKNRNSLISNDAFKFTEDKDGRLYVSTQEGIDLINIRKDKNGKEIISFTLIDDHPICKIFAEHKGQVWLSPLNDSLYILSDINGKQKKKNISFATAILKKYPFSSRQIQSFVYDSANKSVYMLLSRDLIKYDEKNGNWQQLPNYKISSQIIMDCALLDDAGFIWFTNGINIFLYDTKEQITYVLSSNDEHEEQMLANANNIFKDRSDNIWIGTKGYGILKYNARAEKFHHTDNESIIGIEETNDGKLLVIKQHYFAEIFDKASGKFTSEIPDTSTAKFNKDYLLRSVLQDATGNYWLSYDYWGAWIYKPAAKTLANKWMNKSYYFPLFNSSDKNVLVCSPDSMFIYNVTTNKYSIYKFPVDNSNSYYPFAEAICQQNDSIFWIGTTSGLLQFNNNSHAWKLYQNNPADETSISSGVVFSLCGDPKEAGKYLWIGTNGEGLDRLDIATGRFIHYTIKNGLPNNVMYGILSDDDGNLWISTNKGLSKFNPSANSFQNYEAKDGLQSNEFNRYAYCKTRDGTLFFGGVNGFNYFNPHDLGKNNVPPNIVITDFKIGNKSVSIHDDQKRLTKPIELTDKIVLNYNDNMISFDFAAMDFTQPLKNLYQYKMQGFDKIWIHAGTARSATYTNLDPGTYTFYVKGSNSDGVWNEKGKSIELVILPPWYMTWWFRTLLILTVIAAAYLFYRYRLHETLKLQTIRNRIASDLHDEIGSNLSSISIFSEVAREDVKDAEFDNILSKINSYSRESMEAMTDIVWMINSSNDGFENIINRMREFAFELIEAKRISLQFDIDDRLNNFKLNMEERKNFWLIYKEAVNNAVKYSDATILSISMQLVNGYVILVVKDNGHGFDEKRITLGNGLKNMQQRAAFLKGELKIVTGYDKGTTVQLTFKS